MIAYLILLALDTLPPPPERHGMMLIESRPPISVGINGTYRCGDASFLTVALSQGQTGVVVNSLRRNGRPSTAKVAAEIDHWLLPLKTLVSMEVECAEKGAIVTVYGRRAPIEPALTQVVFGWVDGRAIEFPR